MNGKKLNGIKHARLNIFHECKSLGWGLWQCPPFLFLVMGTVTIVSMLVTYSLSTRFVDEPEIAALIVMFVAVLFLVVGNLIITGFNRVAEANRMKAEFISTISHQLRSPLSIFKWTLDVVERAEQDTEHGKPDGKAQMEKFIQTLRDTTENMIHLVNSLLEASRIEARTFVLKQEVFSVTELTDRIVDIFRRYAASSDKSIETKYDPELPLLYSDKDRIAMVVENLIDNALRYTPPGKKIIVSIVREDGHIRWSIEDEGMGIPEAQKKYIFQKFFRAENVRNLKVHGSGIGLYIARAIIEASGGEIDFESVEGKGSRFWFTLPMQ